jgi:hypothetical protein
MKHFFVRKRKAKHNTMSEIQGRELKGQKIQRQKIILE